MKKIVFVFLLMSSMCFGQAFKGASSESWMISGGASNYNHISQNYLHKVGAFSILLQREWGFHKYISTGTSLNIGFGKSYWRYSNSNILYRTNMLYILSGAFANFHFYELIADKIDKNIHSDQLDIYVGLGFGLGIGIGFVNQGNGHNVIKPEFIYQLSGTFGVRYFPNGSNFGIMGEVGWGKSLFQLGVCLNL